MASPLREPTAGNGSPVQTAGITLAGSVVVVVGGSVVVVVGAIVVVVVGGNVVVVDVVVVGAVVVDRAATVEETSVRDGRGELSALAWSPPRVVHDESSAATLSGASPHTNERVRLLAIAVEPTECLGARGVIPRFVPDVYVT